MTLPITHRFRRRGYRYAKDAELHLQSAVDLCVTGLWPDDWADILLPFARLLRRQKCHGEAFDFATSARAIS